VGYTLRLNKPDVEDNGIIRLVAELVRVSKGHGFTFELVQRRTYQGLRGIKTIGDPGWRNIVALNRIRLEKAKPYCGQHPGECVLGGPKMKSRLLEWDDWIRFNNLMNDVVERTELDCDIWSNPRDTRGTFYIRRRNSRRVRYDWTEQSSGVGRPLRVWNNGSDDQFALPSKSSTGPR
jgi:hypothetical protein